MKAIPLLLVLSGCAMQPAHADALPPGFVPRHTDFSNTPQASAPARPNRGVTLPKEPLPELRGGPAPGLIFDTPPGWRPPGQRGGGPWAGTIPGYTMAVVPLSEWRGAPPGWNPPGIDGPGLGDGGGGGGGFPDPSPKPRPETPVVPGPLPIAGAAAAWGWARRLRRRVGR